MRRSRPAAVVIGSSSNVAPNAAPNVPAALLAERQADVEKSLQLAEKYCIVSKAVKSSVPVTVTPKPV